MMHSITRCLIGSAIAAFGMLTMAADLIEPSPHRKPVTDILIETNRSINEGSSAARDGEDCRRFKVTNAIVRSFLRRAIAVQSLHDYQYGGCSADGHVTFADGSKATWLLMSSRIGYLTFSDGRTYNLFCRYEICRERIFAYYDGVNSDSEGAEKEDREEEAAAKRGRRVR